MAAKHHFVVLADGRTESSWLDEAFDESKVAAFGELFHDDKEVRSTAARGTAVVYHDGEDGADYLRRFYAGGQAPRGFRLLLDQARNETAATAWDFIRVEREIAVIHLVRRDLLASWLWYELARRTDKKVWLREELSRAEAPPFAVDANELGRFFESVAARRAWVRHALARPDFLEIGYEDGLRDRFGPTISRIVEFVGADASPPHRLTRGRPSHISPERQISNFDELRERFRHTPHEEFFKRPVATGRDAAHPGFCPRPFEFYGVDAAGKIRVCCEDWLPTPIGDVRSGSLKDQWNSPTAVAIRESILDGSYRYCNKKLCPDLVKGTLPGIDSLETRRHRNWVREGRTVLEELPRTLSLGYDATCNLKCSTCRHDFIVLKGPAFDRAAVLQKVIVDELLPEARQAIITGHGDAIASRLYRNLLRTIDASRYPKLRILLMTNGLALDPPMWESFRSAHSAIAGVSISMDAATPETYAINRGGNFDKLIANLRFLGDLCRNGEIDFLEISFVVQANNFREMPDFVRLGRSLGCSTVLFMKLIHWPDTFSEEEFDRRSVHESRHPMHRDFLEILRDPILDGDEVDLSNLADLRAAAPALPEVSCHGG